MGQIRDYTSTFFVIDANVQIRSLIKGSQLADTVVRDGSFQTNFKAACWAHLQAALNLPPTGTSPPCTVTTFQRWIKSQAAGSVAGVATNIVVPSTNSGHLELHVDAGGFTAQYSIAGGSFTTFTDGTVITLTNGQSLAFRGTGLAAQETMSGYVLDGDTGTPLDTISLSNATPAP